MALHELVVFLDYGLGADAVGVVSPLFFMARFVAGFRRSGSSSGCTLRDGSGRIEEATLESFESSELMIREILVRGIGQPIRHCLLSWSTPIVRIQISIEACAPGCAPGLSCRRVTGCVI
jgi:hypothetical protein